MFFRKSQRQSFHLFPNFPREIRTLIWKEVLNEPRVIEVNVVGYFHGQWPSSTPGEPGINVSFPKFSAVGARYPAIFSICQESRWVATRCYEFCLSTVLPPDIDIKPQFHPICPPKEVTPLLRLCSLPGSIYSCVCPERKREKKRRQCGTPKFPPSPQYLSMGVLFQPQIDTIYLRDVPQCPDWWRAFWSLRDYPVDIDIGGIQSLAVENNFLTHKSNVFNLAISSVQRQKTKYPAVQFKFFPRLRKMIMVSDEDARNRVDFRGMDQRFAIIVLMAYLNGRVDGEELGVGCIMTQKEFATADLENAEWTRKVMPRSQFLHLRKFLWLFRLSKSRASNRIQLPIIGISSASRTTIV